MNTVSGAVHSANPFTEQVSVEYFVGREPELRQFAADLAGLKRGTPNQQYVAGLHGTGKTIFLAKLVEMARAEGLIAALPTLDAGALSTSHISTLLRSVIAEVEKTLKPSLNASILRDWDSGKDCKYFGHPRSDELRSDCVRQDFEQIARFMDEGKIAGAVICIDEGQRIDGRALSALKNALQHHTRFLIVISLRLSTDSGGAVVSGRTLLQSKAATEAEGDIGASRFYTTGIGLGPFGTDSEAEQCIRKRLTGNVVQFDDSVIDRVIRISGRTPGNLIVLSNAVYNRARAEQHQKAGLQLLNDAFRDMYRARVAEALKQVENSPTPAKAALKGLIGLRRPAAAPAIAAYLYPQHPPDICSQLTTGIQGNLDRFCKGCSMCVQNGDNFDIPDPVDAYALELALIPA